MYSLFNNLFSKIWESRIDIPALGRLVGDNSEQVFCSQRSPPVLTCGLLVQSSLRVSNQLEAEKLQTIYDHSISSLKSSCPDLTLEST